MARDVVVVFVHGINVTCQDYYEPMRDRLLRALPRTARGHVVFRAAFWADIVRGRQQEYTLYARSRSQYDGTRLHRLVIEGLGDAAAYQKTWLRENSAYYEIQGRLRKTIRDATTGRDDQRPLIFIGHSLGCHIISSYAWDLHKLKRPRGRDTNDNGVVRPLGNSREDQILANQLEDNSAFERLDTFAAFVTMGSNMPLFTFTFGPQYVHPISRSQDPIQFDPAFPGPALCESVKGQSRWLNFYSRNDPLGYPLKPLNDAYDDEHMLFDIPTISEGWFRAFLLRGRLRELNASRAHSGYWTNPKIVRRTARLISNIIFADEIAARKPALRDRWSTRSASQA